jgi:hypothetical protein
MLWGGRFNPIIVVDDAAHASRLLRLFHVDVLYALEHDEVIDSFIAAHPHIRWPLFAGDLLLSRSDSFDGREHCALVDVHAALARAAKNRTERDEPSVGGALLPQWTEDDALSLALVAMFGEYPDNAWGEPLSSAFTATFGKQRRTLDRDEPLPSTMWRQVCPLSLTDFGLLRSRGGLTGNGVFVGTATSFDDLVEFWNLKAADHSLLFFDTAYRERLAPLVRDYVAAVKQAIEKMPTNAWNARLSVWHSRESPLPEEFEGVPILHHSVDRVIWNGLNERSPIVATVGSIAAGSVENDTGRPTLAFQPEVPDVLRDLRYERQLAVMTIRPHSTFFERDGFTFSAPNVPELNEYYGRSMIMRPGHARAAVDGLGVIGELSRSYTTLLSLSVSELFKQLFAAFGITTKPSRSGTIARQLLRQMGGLDGCRVFKIRGVRKLIDGFSAQRAFTRSQALKYIGPGFPAYRNLFIEPRDAYELTPNDAFRFLVRKGVLRPGLEFVCPTCRLEFWALLDDARTQMKCQFCDAEFNAGAQLRDNDGWKYRRSGLFGYDNHQEGGIPVALALQRFEESISDMFRSNLFTTALDVEQGGPISGACEIDFAFLAHDANGKPQLALGEAKAGKSIDDTDVSNLAMIAAAFPKERIDVFATFAKAEEFSYDELRRLLEAKDVYPRRRILLSRHELEPYHLFDRLKDLPGGESHANSLQELADATHRLYSAVAAESAVAGGSTPE